jgi:predicted DsbA family dithiol-disulfide isomerase
VPLSFGVTFDYRCPFARNVHEHVVAAIEAGADWDVRFLPFSLSQAKVDHGAPSVWEEPDQDSGIVAMQLGIAVRDTQPDVFPAAHRALFAVRHDDARSLRDEDVLREKLAAVGVDVDAAFAEVASGVPLKTIAAEHEAGVREHHVWGVPTFVAGDQAAFVRLMDRPIEGGHSIKTIERLVGLLGGWPELNEFKHTSIPR